MANEPLKWTIGAVAVAADVSVETIRFYQRKGLLPTPKRPAAGFRRYGSSDIDRVKFVKNAQRLGFTLGEIAALLKLDLRLDCDQARDLAEQKLADVRSELVALRQLEQALIDTIANCSKTPARVACPLIVSLHAGTV